MRALVAVVLLALGACTTESVPGVPDGSDAVAAPDGGAPVADAHPMSADTHPMSADAVAAPVADARPAIADTRSSTCTILGQSCTDGLREGTCYLDPASRMNACCLGCLTGVPSNPATHCLPGVGDDAHCGGGGTLCRTCGAGASCLPAPVSGNGGRCQ
jgi:hypothetical protein